MTRSLPTVTAGECKRGGSITNVLGYREALWVALAFAFGCGDPPLVPPPVDTGSLSDTSGDADAGSGDASADTGGLRDTAVDTTPCDSPPGADMDEDGFLSENDCNDCIAQINPGAFDLPLNDIDEDCDGADATEVACDGDVRIAADGNLEGAARALGICQTTTEEEDSWGVLSSRFTRAAGDRDPRSLLQIGMLPRLGVLTPLEGDALLALSSGVARDPSQPDYTTQCDTFGANPEFPIGLEPYPQGFPIMSSTCPGVMGGPVYNSAAYEVTMRVPTNATGLAFRSNFLTHEFPIFICSEFNDLYGVLFREGGDDVPFTNIVFDSGGETVSVNSGLFRVCAPGRYGGRSFGCSFGRSPLQNTGFGGGALCGSADNEGSPVDPDLVGGSTSWLETTAPVRPGTIITLRFMIWDSSDPFFDSTVLIDQFEWILGPLEVGPPSTGSVF